MATWGHGLWRPPPAGRSRLGRYVLRAEIGRGGMGSVFVAEREGAAGFRKRVAIKVLRADLASPALAASLRREAGTAVLLDHPHIAQVLDYLDGDEDGGQPALVLEYVHGESLAAVIEAIGALPAAVATSIAIALADALAYAHAPHDGRADGVVHRDVSPQNVLITYRGVPKLVDFGIAQGGDAAGADAPGEVRGRPAYMAPEQRRGERVDGRADLYALGVVLYEMVAGRHPWQVAGERVERPPPPEPCGPEVPAPLWDVIRRATEPHADDRYPNAGEMLAALRACADRPGGPRDRDELARLVDAAFAERRREKERILADDLGVDGDTELLDAPAAAAPVEHTPTGRGERAPEVRPRSRLRGAAWLAGAVVAVVAAVSISAHRGGRAAAVAPRATSPCVLVDPTISPADHDAAWAAARIVGIALDHAPGAAPVHGYRAEDRYGWTADGLARAEVDCRRHHARAFVLVSARRGGAVSAAVAGGRASRDLGTLAASATALAGDVAGRLGLEPSPARPVPSLDDRGTIAYLRAREDLVQEASTAGGRDAVVALSHDYPSLEDGAVDGMIVDWWAGELDDGDRLAADATPVASRRGLALRAAVVALARHDPGRAVDAMSALAADGGLDADPLAQYLAGEAFVHAGRAADGALHLERALALDPQLTPAMYHLFLQRLARGDRAGVEELARLRGRIDPSGLHGDEYVAWAALGAGDYDRAIEGFEALLRSDESTRSRLNGPDAGIVHALLLSGRGAAAHDYARRLGGDDHPPALSSVMVEPIMYADALGTGDLASAGRWEARLRARLGAAWDTANHWQLAYVMAILDTLAGRPDARARWIGAGPPAGLPRAYRYAAFAGMLDALDGRGARAAGADRWTAQVAAGLARARRGDLGGAVRDLDGALASSPDGEFDCIVAAELARLHARLGQRDQAARACARVLRPHVPRAYCYVVRPWCAPASGASAPAAAATTASGG